MKATTNTNRASRMATVLFAALAFGTSTWAQPYAGSAANSPDEFYDRLETLMNATEIAAKYVAPSIDDAEIFEAMERLELWANNTENNIRYEAPSSLAAELNEAVERLEVLASNIEKEIRYRVLDEEQIQAIEYVVDNNDQDNETLNALTFIIAYLKKQ